MVGRPITNKAERVLHSVGSVRREGHIHFLEEVWLMDLTQVDPKQIAQKGMTALLTSG